MYTGAPKLGALWDSRGADHCRVESMQGSHVQCFKWNMGVRWPVAEPIHDIQTLMLGTWTLRISAVMAAILTRNYQIACGPQLKWTRNN